MAVESGMLPPDNSTTLADGLGSKGEAHVELGHEWTDRTQSRLIEMCRHEHTLEEMARELSLPVDVIERRLYELQLATDESHSFYSLD